MTDRGKVYKYILIFVIIIAISLVAYFMYQLFKKNAETYEQQQELVQEEVDSEEVKKIKSLSYYGTIKNISDTELVLMMDKNFMDYESDEMVFVIDENTSFESLDPQEDEEGLFIYNKKDKSIFSEEDYVWVIVKEGDNQRLDAIKQVKFD